MPAQRNRKTRQTLRYKAWWLRSRVTVTAFADARWHRQRPSCGDPRRARRLIPPTQQWQCRLSDLVEDGAGGPTADEMTSSTDTS
jgi:hypothetical protein